jgi:hypothetical protein
MVSIWWSDSLSGEEENPSSLPDELLREWMSSNVEDALHMLLWGNEGLRPTIEFGNRSGHPSATAIVFVTDSKQTIWCYVTVVFRDDGRIYTLSGTRGTEAEAKEAEASFALLAPAQTGYSTTPPAAPPQPQISNGAIDWTEAAQHIGETVTIYGPVAGSTYASTSNGQPTYIDIGASYPDARRVSIVVWGEDRGNFSVLPENAYLGEPICVTGEIYVYDNACYIKVQSPSQIQVMR